MSPCRMTVANRLLLSWGCTRPSLAFSSIRPDPSGAMPSYLWPLEVLLKLHVSNKNLPGPPKPRPLRKTTSPSSRLGSLRVILSLLMNLCGCSFAWGRVTLPRNCEDLCAGRYWEASFRSALWGSQGWEKQGWVKKRSLNCDTGLFFFLIRKLTYYKTYYLTIFK